MKLSEDIIQNIFRLNNEGMTRNRIAKKLGINWNTVDKYLSENWIERFSREWNETCSRIRKYM